MNQEHLIVALEEHIKRSKEIVLNLNLPKYPAGGTVGIAALSGIRRNLSLAETELMGLKSQLEYHREHQSA